MDKFERARLLLEITERIALHSGKLTAIGSAAMAELMKINEEFRQEAVAKAEAANPVEQPADDEVDLFDDNDDDNVDRRL